MSYTFSMIKPDAYSAGQTGALLQLVEQADFRITALQLTQLSQQEAARFYAVHSERPFFDSLCLYMSSGPIVAFVLAYPNDAVGNYRTLIGNTDPKQADPDTLRARFGTSIEANAVHGSDSAENAQIEANFFFPNRNIFA